MITLADIDDLIIQRLRRICFGTVDGEPEPIPIYAYLPDRDKGNTVYPSVAFQRLTHHILSEDVRSGHSVFKPSSATQTIQVQRDMGGGTVTGPQGFTRKPYPTPVVVTYEIHTLATVKAHADYLLTAMYSAIPAGYSPTMADGQRPIFCHDKPICLDDLDKPEFRTSYLFDIRPVWIDRLEAWSNAPITSISADFTTLDI
jgi:hypothetical protein